MNGGHARYGGHTPYEDHTPYEGHAPYSNSNYGNGYSEGRRTTRRRLLPATPTGEMSYNPN